ncbi:MAG: UDP-2,3-diacylglucosamine diphosphatase [Candidatus Wenzhouxiangella sp. M2_3B_020]
MSDLHLSPARPDISEQFREFLRGEARAAEALYILGDLFEAWVGDDAAGTFERTIADDLREVAEAGTEIAFLRGNRDFLMGPEYCEAAGMTLLEQPVAIDLYGMSTVLLHGDTLCTLDAQYQRYRKRVTDPEWQARMLSRPVWFRRAVAALLRGASRLRNRRGERPEMDVTDEAVEKLFLQSGAVRMIHGHTHRPGRHEHVAGRLRRERIVLGDWYTQGSVLTVSRDGTDLRRLRR